MENPKTDGSMEAIETYLSFVCDLFEFESNRRLYLLVFVAPT